MIEGFDSGVAEVNGTTYGKLAVPVLGLGGLYGEAMRGAVAEKASDFRFVAIPDAGHHLALENPDAVVKAVGDFLRET